VRSRDRITGPLRVTVDPATKVRCQRLAGQIAQVRAHITLPSAHNVASIEPNERQAAAGYSAIYR